MAVAVEATPKRAFASAIDWPGWSRGDKSVDLATERLLAYAPRYAAVAALAGLAFQPEDLVLEVVERADGDAATEFGVPGHVAASDRRPSEAAEAGRQASLVAAAWQTFDAIAAVAPEELRKGPRGGGRNTSKVVDHVVASEHGYSRELGLRLPAADPTDRDEVGSFRAAMLEVLRRPSDGSPMVKRWTPRYAARRIAWHALDHAWEIEDRSAD